ncbi:MAG: hypothetical protein LBS36_13645 [Oscillospiraceae bacterium]|nr:hypothetical protein [Oscillospiraceae bacterium]
MQVDGAIIKEYGVTFSIILVNSRVLRNMQECDEIRREAQSVFPSPIILMAQDSRGTPTYQGCRDIIDFLSAIRPSRIVWKQYTI